tara:strand:- start:726 stop:1271 length:546 start_codon:yes stop_codon:yes gene_type:complete
MKIKQLLILCIFLLGINGVQASGNSIKYVPNLKFGKGIGTFSNDIEYERNIVPFTTGFVRYGSASYDIPGASSVNAKFTNMSIGVRYNLIAFYVGTGYESSQVELTDGSTNGKASGTISGPMVEIGQTFGLGPVASGIALGVQMATNKISYDNSANFSIGDLNLNGSVLLYKIEFYAGINF